MGSSPLPAPTVDATAVPGYFHSKPGRAVEPGCVKMASPRLPPLPCLQPQCICALPTCLLTTTILALPLAAHGKLSPEQVAMWSCLAATGCVGWQSQVGDGKLALESWQQRAISDLLAEVHEHALPL